jgi:HlyD family secretion protein
MTANVTFVYAERKSVLRIPSAALRFRPPEELLATAGKGDGIVVGKKKKKHKIEKEAAAADAPPPTGAAASTSTSPMKSVWVLDGDKLKEVPIEIGVSDGSKVEVRNGGIAEGDVLVTDAIAKGEGGGKKKGLF